VPADILGQELILQSVKVPRPKAALAARAKSTFGCVI
jgi:hypothetical protein